MDNLNVKQNKIILLVIFIAVVIYRIYEFFQKEGIKDREFTSRVR
jgi:hypothetical protein